MRQDNKREWVREQMRKLSGKEPSEASVDAAYQGYLDEIGALAELTQGLPDQQVAQVLDAEAAAIVDELNGNQPKPN